MFILSCSKEDSAAESKIITISSLSVATDTDWVSVFTRSNSLEDLTLNDQGYRGLVKDSFVEGDALNILIFQASSGATINYTAKYEGQKWVLYNNNGALASYITIDINTYNRIQIYYKATVNGTRTTLLYFYGNITSEGITAVKGKVTNSSASSLSIVMDYMMNFVDVDLTTKEGVDITAVKLIDKNGSLEFPMEKVAENRFQYQHAISKASSISVSHLFLERSDGRNFYVLINSKDEFGNLAIELTGNPRFDSNVTTNPLPYQYPKSVYFYLPIDITALE